jgi:hypothetical protein
VSRRTPIMRWTSSCSRSRSGWTPPR